MSTTVRPVSWHRMSDAVENVRRRCRDRVHLRDLHSVGLIDASWSAHLPPALRPRFEEILATPEG